ncbi:MAG: hypothetical protein KAW84_00335 [Thermoplasmata archaeon]|nr:hypothetical protein [Thermoplasmata archaeon]
MPLRRRLSLVQRILLIGAVLCVILGVLMMWLRDMCVDTYFAEIIGCRNTPYDVGIYAMNIAGALIMTFLVFLDKYPRVLGLSAIVLGLVLIWVGDIGSFFGGLFSLSAGLLTLTSLL